MPLADTKCRSAKPRDKPYKLADGGGLYLHILTSGTRVWRWKYIMDGKEYLLTIGTYPTVSVADAREAQSAAKKKLAAGISPAHDKQVQKHQRVLAAANTFARLADEWYEYRKPSWTPRHAVNIRARLDNDLIPALGKRAIKSIDAPEVLQVIRSIEKRGAHDTARRSLQYCRAIFAFAIGSGRATVNPASDLQGQLQEFKQGHFASMDFDRLKLLTRLATKFLMYTLVRTNELIKATWDEIDLKKAVWHIPAERMKQSRPHIVPLSKQAVAILVEVRKITGGDGFVFPSDVKRDQHMSEGTILGGIKRMGFKGEMTGHGFRALGMTAIKERLKNYRHEVIDRQLAHAPKNRIAAAYDRAAFLDERTTMMQDYADLIDRTVRQHKRKRAA